jgi:hypothetical protein
MRTCNLCEKKHFAKGFCRLHYDQSSERKAYLKIRNGLPRVKEYYKAYQHTPKWKKYLKTYEQTPKRMAYKKAYDKLPKRKDYHKSLIIKRRELVFNHYGNKCVCCGESNQAFLSIDHINNDGAKHKRELGRRTLYTWLIKNMFPDGFQLLCMNCNCAKQWWGKCPHQDSSKNS